MVLSAMISLPDLLHPMQALISTTLHSAIFFSRCAGAALATLLLQARNTVSLGASGAVFGLFTVSVLCKFRLNIKKLLECAVLGPFVFKQVMQVCNLLSAGLAACLLRVLTLCPTDVRCTQADAGNSAHMPA